MLAAAGVDAQGRYYFSRNVMPSVVRYQPVQQSYSPARQNTYAAQQQYYNPYVANWARPVVSVAPQRQQPIQQQYRPTSNYYGYHHSGENNSGESREVYRRYW